MTYWSKKLTETQQKYRTTDQELLVIVEYLKQYKTMLLGQTITAWTDHRNLTYKNIEHASDRVLRQRLLLEKYAVNLKFIQGIKNVAADMLSRNELVFERTKKVSTESFEELVHEVHSTKYDSIRRL